jgi:hypothetical protein
MPAGKAIPTPTGRVSNVRKIEQHPNTPVGQLYLRTVNTNSLDRQLGTLPAKDIRAKVIWIIKAN